MRNLYSMARSRDEERRLFRVDLDRTGNQPSLPAIFPDQLAPVVTRPAMSATDGMRVIESIGSKCRSISEILSVTLPQIAT